METTATATNLPGHNHPEGEFCGPRCETPIRRNAFGQDVAKVKSGEVAEAWRDGATLYLREPSHASSVLSIYLGPNYDPEAYVCEPWEGPIHVAVRTASKRAETLAQRWRGLTYEQARAEYDALP